MPEKKYAVIIVAAGSGNRMKSDVPKQFLSLARKPVLMHTIEAFYSSSLHPRILVVLNTDFYQYWEDLCLKYSFTIPHKLVPGGAERFFSVKNALTAIEENTVIAIHDGVRPVISEQLITNSFLQAEEKGSAVCGVPSRDSVRQLTANTSVALNRDGIYLIQTPQTFRGEILKKAYEQEFSTEFTDDASVVEKAGFPVHLIPGETSNIKITFPEDVDLAELLLNKKIRH